MNGKRKIRIAEVCYQLGVEGRRKRDWRAKEPRSFWEEGEKDGMMPRGKPLPRNESCWTRRTRLARAPSRGKGSPGTARAVPWKVWGEEMSKSQNAASMAVRRFAITALPSSLPPLSFLHVYLGIWNYWGGVFVGLCLFLRIGFLAALDIVFLNISLEIQTNFFFIITKTPLIQMFVFFIIINCFLISYNYSFRFAKQLSFIIYVPKNTTELLKRITFIFSHCNFMFYKYFI